MFISSTPDSLTGYDKQYGRRVRPTRYASIASNPDLWPFDLETGVRVACKIYLPSKFWDARPLGSRIIRYVRDGRTDRRTDKSNAYCPFPMVGGMMMN